MTKVLDSTGSVKTTSTSDFTASSTDTLTNKTFDANGTGNSLSNVDLTADVINDLPVTEGGTGASTLTDGGVLLGSGTSAVTAMSVLTDGQMIVGDGTTDPVAESGATLRTSVGVGTGDSPQFTGIELGHATDTTVTRASAGDLNIEGNIAYRAGGTDVPVTDGGTGASSLTDGGVLLGSGTGAVTAMAVLADGEVIVGDGTTDPVAESGATLRTSVGVAIGSDVQAFDADLTELATAYTTEGATTAATLAFLEGTNNGTNKVTLAGPAATADVTVTLPAAADTLVGKATTDTFTNKTFDANGTGNALSNVDVADLANGTDGELITWDASAGPTTVAVGSADQVLTSNGAGAAPTFQASTAGDLLSDTTPQLGGQLDVNGNAIGNGTLELIAFTEDASAVNHINVENQATGSGPIISAAGDDTNIDLNLNGLLTGNVILRDGTDVTKELSFEVSGATTGKKATIITAHSDNRSITLPNATDTLVGKATTDTFTNKTFDANGTGNALSNVDVADLANGTDGELITWDANGAPAAVGVGTSAQVLTSNGAGAAPTFQAAAGGGGGKVLQIIQEKMVSTFTTTSTDTYVDVTGLTETITPANTANVIMIHVYMTVHSSSSGAAWIQLLRGTTLIAQGAAAGSRKRTTTSMPTLTDADQAGQVSFSYRDAPSTTSATTYKVQVRQADAGTIYVNRTETDTDSSEFYRAMSNMVVIEYDQS